MRVRRFVAAKLPDALAQVKQELGPDALILGTQLIRVGGLFGLFGRRMIQVTAGSGRSGPAAAIQTAIPPPEPPPDLPPEPPPELSAKTLTDLPTGPLPDLPTEPPLPVRVRMEPELRGLRERLLIGGVEPRAVSGLLTRVRRRLQADRLELSQALSVAAELMQRDMGRPRTLEEGARIVLLAGATGSGVSAAAARLAAHMAKQRQWQVALLTAGGTGPDPWPQAAGPPQGVHVDRCPDEVRLQAALEACRTHDLILVQAPEQNLRAADEILRLKRLLDLCRPCDLYLVVSLTTAYREALHGAQQLAALGLNRYLFSNYAEAAAPGLVYSMVQGCRRPLTYLTDSRAGASGVMIADPLQICRAILSS